jgi:hypothetical protein
VQRTRPGPGSAARTALTQPAENVDSRGWWHLPNSQLETRSLTTGVGTEIGKSDSERASGGGRQTRDSRDRVKAQQGFVRLPPPSASPPSARWRRRAYAPSSGALGRRRCWGNRELRLRGGAGRPSDRSGS